MKILVPEISQSSPSRTALAFMCAGSEPWSGSVRPKQASFSPRGDRPSARYSFCSSLPWARMILPTSPSETETIPRTEESARPSSSMPIT